jgi:hypothetical protein
MPATFPGWARFALGCLVAVLGYLTTGDVIHIGDDERALIAAVIGLLASAGVVPPRPGDMPPWLATQAARLVLTLSVVLASYLLQAVLDPEPVLRGILQAFLYLAASVGIVPPQAEAGPVAPAGRGA